MRNILDSIMVKKLEKMLKLWNYDKLWNVIIAVAN